VGGVETFLALVRIPQKLNVLATDLSREDTILQNCKIRLSKSYSLGSGLVPLN
jgi:hypothetical protein